MNDQYGDDQKRKCPYDDPESPPSPHKRSRNRYQQQDRTDGTVPLTGITIDPLDPAPVPRQAIKARPKGTKSSSSKSSKSSSSSKNSRKRGVSSGSDLTASTWSNPTEHFLSKVKQEETDEPDEGSSIDEAEFLRALKAQRPGVGGDRELIFGQVDDQKYNFNGQAGRRSHLHHIYDEDDKIFTSGGRGVSSRPQSSMKMYEEYHYYHHHSNNRRQKRKEYNSSRPIYHQAEEAFGPTNSQMANMSTFNSGFSQALPPSSSYEYPVHVAPGLPSPDPNFFENAARTYPATVEIKTEVTQSSLSSMDLLPTFIPEVLLPNFNPYPLVSNPSGNYSTMGFTDPRIYSYRQEYGTSEYGSPRREPASVPPRPPATPQPEYIVHTVAWRPSKLVERLEEYAQNEERMRDEGCYDQKMP